MDKVYAEMKRVHVELKTIEKTLEDLVDSILPTVKMSAEEKAELCEIEAEMARGECVSLEEVKREFSSEKPVRIGGKKAVRRHAKVPRRVVQQGA